MPTDDIQILVVGAASVPFHYTVPGSGQLQPKAVNATFDGTGAAGSFLPTLEIISDGGVVVARCPTGAVVAAGGSAEVSWFPHVGGAGGAATSTTVVSFATFAPAAGFVTITSTNQAAPTNIITCPAFTADGVSQYRVDFGVAAIDLACTNGGAGLANVGVLTRDATIVGNVWDYNINPVNGTYGSTPTFVSVFDLPAAGVHTYSMGAFKSLSGGATGTSFAYGSNLGPPFVGVTHPGYIAVLQVVTV